MNKAVMISIKPQYCELIAAGKKTIEVRKSKPKLETPFKVYIYQSTETRLMTAYKKGETTGYKDDDGNDILFDEFVPVRKLTFNQRKVIGEYVCEYVREYPYVEGEEVGEMYYNITTAEGEATGLTYPEFAEYGKGKTLYGWFISNLVMYDEPKELSEFKKINRDCVYSDLGLAIPNCDKCKEPTCFIQRPPQSWFYVEEINV